jgi:hypothetical protein
MFTATATHLPDLHEITAYKHPAVVARFQKEHPARAADAEEIFTDLMRFFWASQKHHRDRQANPKNPAFDFMFIMDEEMKGIDLMWHVFLLYTKDYMEFCSRYFGEYIHHLPDIVPNLPQDPEAFEANLKKFLSYTYDNLGESVLRRWFREENEMTERA